MPEPPDNSDEEPIRIEPGPGGQEDDEPISLVEPSEARGPEASSVLRSFGSLAAKDARKVEFKRSLNVTGQGATRCRVFHSKIAVASLEHMQDSINEWLDSEEIEIKHVGHVIGTMEGKRPEPNVIVVVWY